ncbi:MAG TPA: restriction endonuclease subunit S [Defluviitaleaceae bacterium]|nr:restriction endonuclease subunit S [Defluviitaleaceae bacterium]
MQFNKNKNLSKGWRKVKLGEIADINMGQSPHSEFYNSRGEGLPFYQGVTDFNEKYPKRSIYCSQPIKIAEAGDILFSVRAPVGDINVATEKSCIGRGVAALRMKNRNNDFLYFLLKTYERHFRGVAGGTTYESINKDQIENIELLVPKNPTEQKRIASILSAFDDKIELNNKINQTLEEMAQVIFKEWFIKNQKAKIKKQKLGDLVNITYGKGPASNELKKSGYPVYGANGIIGYCDSYSCSDRQIIIGCRGVVGNITLTLPKCTITHNSLVLTPLNNRKIFLYYLLKNQKLDAIAGGSAQPQITIRDLENFELAIPDEKIQDKFESIVNIIEQKRLNNFYENQKLAEFRDLLLPKLMSGEVRV